MARDLERKTVDDEVHGADEDDLRPRAADDDQEGYRYGWQAGIRGAYAVQDWSDVEPLLRLGWEEHHRALACQVAHDWHAVVGAVRRGWDAARRELEASL